MGKRKVTEAHATSFIAEGWKTYRRQVVPDGANSIQIRETRRAFYAGAAWLLSLAGALGEDDTPEDVGVEILNGIHEEITRFSNDVASGRG
jgi:hypothetical protein